MKRMRTKMLSCVYFLITLIAFQSCQDRKENELDPILVDHLKDLVETRPDVAGKIVKIRQFELSKAIAYRIMPGSCYFWIVNMEGNNIYPTKITKYKDVFFFFYLLNEQELKEEEICRIINVASEDDTRKYGIETGLEWLYLRENDSDVTFWREVTDYDGQESLLEKYM